MSESMIASALHSTVGPSLHSSLTSKPLSRGVTDANNLPDEIQRIVYERLQNEGLTKLRLPLGASPADRHLNILVSTGLSKKSRIVIIFGEPHQMHGVLALRVANGPGGINKGSLVTWVQGLQAQPSSPDDPSPPGVILANIGELYWWPEGKRSLDVVRQHAVAMPSGVHRGRKTFPRANGVPGNKTVEKSVAYVFNVVIPQLVGDGSNAQIDVVGIGDGSDAVERYFSQKDHWKKYEGKMHAMVILGGLFDMKHLECEGFKDFLEKVSFLLCLSVFLVAFWLITWCPASSCLHQRRTRT
jgi:hypothetical protein